MKIAFSAYPISPENLSFLISNFLFSLQSATRSRVYQTSLFYRHMTQINLYVIRHGASPPVVDFSVLAHHQPV